MCLGRVLEPRCSETSTCEVGRITAPGTGLPWGLKGTVHRAGLPPSATTVPTPLLPPVGRTGEAAGSRTQRAGVQKRSRGRPRSAEHSGLCAPRLSPPACKGRRLSPGWRRPVPTAQPCSGHLQEWPPRPPTGHPAQGPRPEATVSSHITRKTER